jgi:hypothetical protein
MQNRNMAWGVGFLVCGVLAACAPRVHELGDAPVGNGGSSALQEGGSTATPTPGAAGTPENVGGASPEPEPCFSPTSSPSLGLVQPDAGCACAEELPECVLTEQAGSPTRVAFYCEEGKWTTEPRFPPTKPVCGDRRQADCRVKGVTYPHGAARVPAPFSRCNTCSCSNGELVGCSGHLCADTECDEGSFRAKRCVACGLVDECLEVETGCLSGTGCETGVCESLVCV